MGFLEKILSYYNLTREEYAGLARPVTDFDLWDMSLFSSELGKITATIADFMKDNRKIVIYGDYDADGIMAASILVKTFGKMDYPVGYYIPSRYLDGYGLTVDKVREFHEKDYRLIITVDNGVSAHEAISEAYALGMKVIITDHHQTSLPLPRNEGVLHPIYNNDGALPSCGAAMSLVLSKALLGYYDDYLIALASIATVADVMPLKGVNRSLVKLGLDYMNRNNYLPLYLLNGNNQYETRNLSMKIAPAVNAVGRIVENSNINRLVPFFTSSDQDTIHKLSSWIKEVNDKRKMMTAEVLKEGDGIRELDNSVTYISHHSAGLNGILASRYAHEKNKPALVLSRHPLTDEEYIGSIRTPSQYDLSLFLAEEEVVPLLVNGGGHANAAGITVRIDSAGEFINLFEKYFIKHVLKEKNVNQYIELSVSEMTKENFDILNTFAPFGHQFAEPVFRITKINSDNFDFIKDGRYLSAKLGENRQLLSFSYGSGDFEADTDYNLYGNLTLNVFRNVTNIVFQAEKIEKYKS